MPNDSTQHAIPPTQRARALRRTTTPAEARLWQHLRDRRLNGLKFRRQHPVGPFYADFSCPAAGLVVEVDGDTHGERAAYDTRRTEWLSREGYEVVRVTNEDVYLRLDTVLEMIREACERRIERRRSELLGQE